MKEGRCHGSRLETLKEKCVYDTFDRDYKSMKGFWGRIRLVNKQGRDKKEKGDNLSSKIFGTPITVRSDDDEEKEKENIPPLSVESASPSFDYEGSSLCSSFTSFKSQAVTIENQRKPRMREPFFENDRIVPMNLRITEYDISHNDDNDDYDDDSFLTVNSIVEDELATIPCTDSVDISTIELPKNLISVGMYTPAVTLLTDERFIKKRIQQLSGNIDQASKYHIEDVIHLVRSFSPRRCHRGLEIEEGAFTTCNTVNASTCSNSKNETVDLKETAVNIYHKFIVIVMASLNVTDDNSTTAGNIIVDSSDYGRCQHQFEEEEKNAVIARLFYLMGQSLSNDFGWKEESMQLYNMYILNVILNDDDEENNETNAVTARKTKIFRAMGDIHLEQENWEEALSAYNYAQSLIETKVEKQPWQTCHLVLDLLMSSIQLRIGNLYCKQGFLSDALCAYNKARDLQLSCQAKQIELQDDESRTSLILRQLSYTLHNIGVVRRHMDDLDGALDAFLTSISTLEEAAEQISTLEDELRKANTFNNMAGVLRRLERFGEAFLLYKETLRIKKQYLSESHPSISLTLAAMASTLRAGGQEQRAMKYYKAALK